MMTGIDLAINGKDNLSPKMRRLSKNSRKTAGDMGRSWGKAMKPLTRYGDLLGSILSAKVISRGFAMMEQGAMAVGQSVMTLDQSLQNASVKFDGKADRGSKGWIEMKALVEDLGATTEYTAAEVAQGLDFMAMAGFNYMQSMEMMPKMIDLATVAQIDLARASDIASDAIGAFNLDKTGKDMERVADVFSKTVTTSNTTMETLFDTMKMSGSVVTTAGGDIETWAALTGKLGSAGVKGTRAATVLKNAYLRLAAATPKTQKALKTLNVEASENGEMRDMVAIIEDMKGAMKGIDPKDAKGNLKGYETLMKEATELGSADKLKALDSIFGKRAAVGMAVLLQEDAGAIEEYRKTIYAAGGSSKDAAAKARQGAMVQFKIMKSAAMARGHEIVAALMGNGTPEEVFGRFTEYIRNFDVKPIIAGIKELWQFAKGFFTTVKEYWPVIKTFFYMIAGARITAGVVNMGVAFGDAFQNVRRYIGFISGAKHLKSIEAFNAAAGLSGSKGPGQIGLTDINRPSIGKMRMGDQWRNSSGGGQANMVLSVVAAAAIGVAIGTVIWEYWDKKENSQLGRENKLSGLTGQFTGDLRGKTLKELKYDMKEVDRLDASTKRNMGNSLMSRTERELLFSSVKDFKDRAGAIITEKELEKQREKNAPQTELLLAALVKRQAEDQKVKVEVTIAGDKADGASYTVDNVPQVSKQDLTPDVFQWQGPMMPGDF